MLIKLRMIPHNKPLILDFDISPDVLHGEGYQSSQFVADENFIHPAHCHAELRQKHRLDDVELQGSVDCLIEALCSRCGQHFDYPYQEHFFIMCARRQEQARKASGVSKKKRARQSNAVPQDDDFEQAQEGLVFFSNEEIDLAHIIREQILLNLPMRYVCSELCKGLCGDCGEKIEDEHRCKKNSKVDKKK
ncbi:DUF177 domain-containing protein [bacterium]|nr:DUF177 domain-containing protein [bacterium]